LQGWLTKIDQLVDREIIMHNQARSELEHVQIPRAFHLFPINKLVNLFGGRSTAFVAQEIRRALHSLAERTEVDVAGTQSESQTVEQSLALLKDLLLRISLALSPDDEPLDVNHLRKTSYWQVMLWHHRESLKDFDERMEKLAALYSHIEQALHLIRTNERQLEHMRGSATSLRSSLNNTSDIEVEAGLQAVIGTLKARVGRLEAAKGKE
jgi:hypothetical protein